MSNSSCDSYIPDCACSQLSFGHSRHTCLGSHALRFRDLLSRTRSEILLRTGRRPLPTGSSSPPPMSPLPSSDLIHFLSLALFNLRVELIPLFALRRLRRSIETSGSAAWRPVSKAYSTLVASGGQIYYDPTVQPHCTSFLSMHPSSSGSLALPPDIQ